MWNGRKYAAMAIAGVGFAVVAAAPASAQYYGAAGGSGDRGYAGVSSFGPPHANYGLASYGRPGDHGYGGYHGAYGPAYGAAHGADYNDWGTGYGYPGWVPSHSYAGYPLYGRGQGYGQRRGARRVLGYGYGMGDALPYGQVFGAPQHREFAAKPAQDKIPYRPQNLKLAPAN
jgi:hypothetical protein